MWKPNAGANALRSPWKRINICNLKLTWGWNTRAKSRYHSLLFVQPMYGIPSHNHTQHTLLSLNINTFFSNKFQSLFMFHISHSNRHHLAFVTVPFELFLLYPFVYECQSNCIYVFFFFINANDNNSEKKSKLSENSRQGKAKRTRFLCCCFLSLGMTRFQGLQKALKAFNINIIKATSENGVNFLLWRAARQKKNKIRALTMSKMLLRNSNMRCVCCPGILSATPTPSIRQTFFDTPYYSVIHHEIFTCSNDAGDKAQARSWIDKKEQTNHRTNMKKKAWNENLLMPKRRQAYKTKTDRNRCRNRNVNGAQSVRLTWDRARKNLSKIISCDAMQRL